MKTQVLRGTGIACALALLGAITKPIAQAGDTKPLKASVCQTARVALSEVPDDPYFQEIVDELGPPDYVLAVTGIQHNNVAGRCEDSHLEIGYYGFDETTGRLVNRFYFKGMTIGANRDTFEWIGAGVTQLEDDPYTFEYVIVITGGTGRFEGAWGIAFGQGVGPFPYPSRYEGVMSTVGSLMRN